MKSRKPPARAKAERRVGTPAARPRAAGGADDAFSVLGTNSADAISRIAPPPIDLSQSIAGEAQWRAIRAHARDAGYRAAVEQVRMRYLFASPMLLSNTLRTTMDKSGSTFREAMIAVAGDDGLP